MADPSVHCDLPTSCPSLRRESAGVATTALETSLAELHEILRTAFDWSDEHPAPLSRLFKKLPRPAHKGGSLFQTAGLLEEELLQLRRLGVIEGAESQITGDGLLMLADRRLPLAVEFDQPYIKPQLRCTEATSSSKSSNGCCCGKRSKSRTK